MCGTETDVGGFGAVGRGDVGFGAAGGVTTRFGTVGLGTGAVAVGTVRTGTGVVGTGTGVVGTRTGVVCVGTVGAGTGKLGVVRVPVGIGMAGDWRLEPPSGTSASAVPTQRQRARVTVRRAADFIINSTEKGPIRYGPDARLAKNSTFGRSSACGRPCARPERRTWDGCATTAE